jgi:hypothetical protein
VQALAAKVAPHLGKAEPPARTHHPPSGHSTAIQATGIPTCSHQKSPHTSAQLNSSLHSPTHLSSPLPCTAVPAAGLFFARHCFLSSARFRACPGAVVDSPCVVRPDACHQACSLDSESACLPGSRSGALLAWNKRCLEFPESHGTQRKPQPTNCLASCQASPSVGCP